jgi:hypothetical protein
MRALVPNKRQTIVRDYPNQVRRRGEHIVAIQHPLIDSVSSHLHQHQRSEFGAMLPIMHDTIDRLILFRDVRGNTMLVYF